MSMGGREREALALVGPTASGKTGTGIRVAEARGTECINVDSRQVYRRLDIGTAKPTAAQRRRVRHHLLDLAEPDEAFNAGRFRREVEALVPALASENKFPFFVGGTGLYLKVILDGLCAAPAGTPLLRQWLRKAAEFPAGGLQALLERIDPEGAARIHPHDTHRLTRALEVYYLTGETLSDRQARHRFGERSFAARIVGIRREPADLKGRIARRLEEMFEAGFVKEVEGLLRDGLDPSLPSLRAVGYPQVIAYLRRETDLEEAAEQIRRATWQYARRQMTWFRRVEGLVWIDASPGEGDETVAARVLDLLSDTPSPGEG